MGKKGSGSSSRSAITGQYVSKATAARHPKTTVTESNSGKGGSEAHRSAITGRYVTEATATRHPKTTVTEDK